MTGTTAHEFNDERWVEIVDAMAVGDEVSEQDVEYVASHAHEDEARIEQRIWASLATLADDGDRVVASDDSMVERVVAGVRVRDAEDNGTRKGIVIGIATALSAAAAVALWLNLGADPGASVDPVASPEPGAPMVAEATRVVASGTWMAGQHALIAGQGVPLASFIEAASEEACLGLPRVSACAPRASAMSVVSDDEIHLRDGSVAVTVEQGRARPARVGTDRGSASSDAGQFSVSVADGTRVVTVIAIVGPVMVDDPVNGRREIEQGSTVVLGAQDVAGDRPPQVDVPIGDVVSDREHARLSAEELLERAQDRLIAKDTRGALAAYRRLVRAYPNATQAWPALVTLAKLEMKSGQQQSALRHYNRYLAHGGELDEEARYGRIQALHATGATVQEAKAIEVFLDKHPRSRHVGNLRARLTTLTGGTP